ncbi:MAG TPA: protein translocase subunit SecF [Candidatus Krumholzibacteria bacterium]|nr:protein translocase subunit SecF [Candidatus Krumholzibacteria bacterium]
MHFFHNANFNFVKFRRRAMLGSAIVILAGFASMLLQGGLKMSIDFAGGALVEIGLQQPVPVQEVRSIIGKAGFNDAEITRFGQEANYLIKVKNLEGQSAEVPTATAARDSMNTAAVRDTVDTPERIVAKRIETALSAGIAGQKVEVRRVETVGPKVGSELRKSAFLAVIYSLLGILIYISWRFQFRFAVAAILATAHDATVMLAFFSFAGLEMSISGIAAILTIVGYSLADTVVVFDRIRENLGLRRREDFGTLINTSINETLSRTIITSGTVMLTLVALLVFGGAVIREFAMAMTVGIIAGTYSSIFIAAPILLEWQMWKPTKRK